MSQIQLSSEQQKIVDLDSGQHLVLAPPGTGKTELLVHRIRKAVKQNEHEAQYRKVMNTDTVMKVKNIINSMTV